MKKIFKALNIVFLFTFIILAFIACDEDFNTLGSDIIGEQNFETQSARFSALSYNKKLNPVQTNGLPSNLLGVYNDPVYGLTRSSIVTQVTPITFDPSFGEEAAIDSVVISIPYFNRIDTEMPTSENGEVFYKISDSLYGDENGAINPFQLTISENTFFLRDFDPNSELIEAQTYYSNSNQTINFDAHLGTEIYNNNNFVPSNKEIKLTSINSETGEEEITQRLIPSLRVSFNNTNPDHSTIIDFWENLILAKEGQPELSNPNNFEDYFRGIHLKATPVNDNGSMIMLNLADAGANISIFYSSKSTTDETQRVQNTYVLNFTENRVNVFDNNFNIMLSDGDNINGDEQLHLKGGEGSMAIVDLFGSDDDDGNGQSNQLEEFKQNRDNWLINEAQLIFYEDESVSNLSNSNEIHEEDRLYLYDLKNNVPIIDYLLDQSENNFNPNLSRTFHTGRREKDSINGGYRFKIRITEHVKNLLRDSTNTKLGLVLSNNINLFQNNTILNSDNETVTSIPTASVISPKGTILYGNNENVPENRRVQLKIYYTCVRGDNNCSN